MKCKEVCPEIQVLHMLHKTSNLFYKSVLCGRCIEVCEDDALNFSIKN
jgi:ferredoxin-type protein NapH